MTYKNVNYLLQFVSFANPGGNCGCKLLFFIGLMDVVRENRAGRCGCDVHFCCLCEPCIRAGKPCVQRKPAVKAWQIEDKSATAIAGGL
jgi:hypothetical protein